MIKLSKRLQALASFVDKSDRITDIGCDHALLDIYLAESYPDMEIIATDIKEGAIKQAQSNINIHKMMNRIDLRLGDGLSVIDKDEINTIIISGLGYAKIIEILFNNDEKLKNVNKLIIQSNTNHYQLRKAICQNGFLIKDEKIVKENDLMYVIICFVKGKAKYSDSDYLMGPILKIKNDSLFHEMMNLDLHKKEILYNIIPHQYLLKRHKLKKEILVLKSVIK